MLCDRISSPNSRCWLLLCVFCREAQHLTIVHKSDPRKIGGRERNSGASEREEEQEQEQEQGSTFHLETRDETTATSDLTCEETAQEKKAGRLLGSSTKEFGGERK